MTPWIMSFFFGICTLTYAMSTKPEVEVPSSDSMGAAYVESGNGNELDNVNAYLNALTSQQTRLDQESSASHKRSYGQGGGYGGGSIIGGTIGSIGGSILSRILRSLSGIGLRLGLNLNNEIYTVPDNHYGGGYGGGGGGGGGYGQRRMQGYEGNAYGHGGVAYANDRQQQGQQSDAGNGRVYGNYIGRYI